MVTLAKIKAACRRANWYAIHATSLEYRVVVTEDNDVEVQERLRGSNGWRPDEIILKTYCYWPHLADWIPYGPIDAVAITWMQSEYINNRLDEDASNCWEAYKSYVGLKEE